jgi:predicted N-acetyltransferase YhbS
VRITYLPDEAVDEALDAELRTLLTRCFGGAFRSKRYHFEMPQHRWLAFDEDALAAHVAVHDKTFACGERAVPFIGVAEVCVAPPYRGRGLVKALLKEAEAHFRKGPFAILLGDLKVYGSSGYRPVHNVYFPFEDATKPQPGVLVKPLRSEVWPEGRVTIEGPLF